MIKIGIIGGAGYTAGELIRVLGNHPEAEIDFVYSTSSAGKPVHEIHHDLYGETDLMFTSEINQNVDLMFLCLGHGKSKAFLENGSISSAVKIIDLSHDFRLAENSQFQDRKFIYGLPEFQKDAISTAGNIANPGCFATAIQLAILPLADAKLLNDDLHVHAITGSTGAGQSLSATTHFSWRNNNVSVYKAFTHQHLLEIGETVTTEQPGFDHAINFVPVRGNFTRGIFSTVYTKTDLSLNQLTELYKSFYDDTVFTHISEQPIHLKQIVNTNKCLLHLEKHGDKVLITSIIDNLVKGASGQAVHNMNLLFGLKENHGLQLKPILY
ncbi:N-acetyl-gamma-glutamyl-phosphate reductase [Fulvivirgaceae bacterium BMA10]|uniref:N-acetyl-gamma-glutamyl-phosphate reductase n=1 Tax=Splendidivirga corallicola TaxID=3051826 RepID=A0ABT8KLJ7_9BACT|nr:N-acetyl-gamma-glutamyl-phosphate reductase [Fulvivirgaceae bacterium BMA10]